MVGVILMIWTVIAFVFLNQIISIWYANLGAVQLSKVELSGFPNTGWAGIDIIPKLDAANATLHMSIQLDPLNRTANQGLGRIAMLRRDFKSAIGFLEIAHNQAPDHRGLLKSLGYAYAWDGDMVRAQQLLSQTPEAPEELDVYKWWWESQGRSDLSKNASAALNDLNGAISQP
jgi:tetratricopeptide (TPR) repeat protein